jgi:hypothetical protein
VLLLSLLPLLLPCGWPSRWCAFAVAFLSVIPAGDLLLLLRLLLPLMLPLLLHLLLPKP